TAAAVGGTRLPAWPRPARRPGRDLVRHAAVHARHAARDRLQRQDRRPDLRDRPRHARDHAGGRDRLRRSATRTRPPLLARPRAILGPALWVVELPNATPFMKASSSREKQ